MKNDFTPETKEIFDMGGWCEDWEDGCNDADCFHHVCKRVSNSPYNCAPLNNWRNHQPEGRTMQGLPSIHSDETRKKYLQKTKRFLEKIKYLPNKNDIKFLKEFKKYYKE
jgi:hypothetical protein